MQWPFQKYWFNELHKSAICRHILPYNVKMSYVKITTDPVRKAFKYYKVIKLTWQIYTFQNSNFYLKTKFYHW